MTAAISPFADLSVRERAPIYDWLARFLVCEVRPADWEALRAGPIREILTRLEPELEKQLDEPMSERREEEMAVEFAKLFLLPGGVSPFVSSWIDGRRSTEPARGARPENIAPKSREEVIEAMNAGLRLLGREPRTQVPWGRLPLDHFATLLDLVARAAEENGFASAPGTTLALRLEQDLLRPSLSDFGREICQQADGSFYRAIGRLLGELRLTCERSARPIVRGGTKNA